MLDTVARLAARSAEAGNGPLDPQVARSVAGGLPAGMAARIAQGLEAGVPPSPAAAAPRAAAPAPAPAPVTVSALGPGAHNWPSGVEAGVQATALARAAGGRSRRAGKRRAGTTSVNARRARPVL